MSSTFKIDDGTTPEGDLTLAELEAIQAKRLPVPKELIVKVSDDGLVQVGNEFDQVYMTLDNPSCSTLIKLLIDARAKAYRILQKQGKV